ncbi:MAG: peroxiredoxin family protein [Desulfosudis oleivorans]|nr:peroxiredoxin family protein [Desulfosudis oleivorans]
MRIAVGDSIEEVKAFRKKYYVNFPIYLDEKGEVAKQYGVAQAAQIVYYQQEGRYPLCE